MITKILFFLFAISLMSSCSSKPAKTAQSKSSAPVPIEAPSVAAKQLAHEEDTSYVTEFAFSKGSAQLSPLSKKKLSEMGKRAFAKGEVDSIKIISWSDKEYPAKDLNIKLSKEQQDLAAKRNQNIEKYLKKILPNKKVSGDIQLVSMAERPGYLSQLMSTDDSRIKNSLVTAGIPVSDNEKKGNAKSSKSIVLILLKDNNKK